MPDVSVPLAIYTGWNLFNAESGLTQLLSSMQGSYNVSAIVDDAGRHLDLVWSGSRGET
jgi:hypothetical protein